MGQLGEQTKKEEKILLAIAKNGKIKFTLTKISTVARMNQGNVKVILKGMERKGWVDSPFLTKAKSVGEDKGMWETWNVTERGESLISRLAPIELPSRRGGGSGGGSTSFRAANRARLARNRAKAARTK